MSDLIREVRARSDKFRVTIITRNFQFDGYLHTPRTGKESRRFTDTLNADRNFLALTDVTITNRLNGIKDDTKHQMIQIALHAIEFIKPYFPDPEPPKQSLVRKHYQYLDEETPPA